MANRAITFSLKYPARALAAVPNASGKSQWLVGTDSLREENEIRVLEYDDLHETLKSTAAFVHAPEVWDVTPCPSNSSNFLTVNSAVGAFNVTLWKTGSSNTLEEVVKLPEHTSLIRRALWHPKQQDLILTIEENAVHKWNASEEGIKHVGKASPGELRELWSGALHPSNPSICATAGGNSIQLWDLSNLSRTGEIKSAHRMPVRDVCFAPHQENRLLSAGDDCKLRVWDLRMLGKPEALLELAGHSHWVWKAQYNTFHDSLIASASSDSLACLWHTPVLAGSGSGGDSAKVTRTPLSPASPTSRETDGRVHSFDEHDDSVYGLAWSSVDPWIFASLSYEGRVVLNQVPKNTKYRVLL